MNFIDISKNSYYKSVYFHLSVLLFVIIPLSFFVPQYLDTNKIISAGNVKLITISEEDYKKIISKTDKTETVSPNAKLIQKDTTSDFVQLVTNEPEKTPQVIKKNKNTEVINKKLPNIQNKQKITNEEQNNTPNITDKDIEDLLSTLNQDDKKEENKLEQETTEIISSSTQKTNIFGDSEDIKTQDINISIKDIVAVQLSRCWNDYYDENFDANDITVTAIIGYNKNGFTNKIDIESRLFVDSYKSDLYNIMVQNVKRSITNCSPLKGLPNASYDEWKYVKINFKHGKKIS